MKITPAQIEETLRAAGISATAQRLAICRYVLCEADHPTAEQVKAWADRNFPKLSLATVYNTLGTLVEAGLLRELRLPHSESVVYDCNTSVHYHLLDERTGKVSDLGPEGLELSVRVKPKGFKISGVDVVIRGRSAKG